MVKMPIQETEERRFCPWVRKTPWRRAGPPTPVFLPEESPWAEEPWQATVHRIAKNQTRLSDLAQTYPFSELREYTLYHAEPFGRGEGWKGRAGGGRGGQKESGDEEVEKGTKERGPGDREKEQNMP